MNGRITIPSQHSYIGWGKVTVTTNKYTDDIGTHYQFNYIINNTSNTNIQGWQIRMNIPTDALVKDDNSNRDTLIVNDKLVIYNKQEDALITPGQQISIYVEITSHQTDYEVTFLELNGIQMNLGGQTVPATAIYINETNVELFPDQSKHLTIRYEPYNGIGAVIWSSSDASIATITPDTGVLTALKPGTCKITATCGNITDSCIVIVKSNIVETENLQIKFVQIGNPWPAEGNFYNVQYSIQVTNISDHPINNWKCDIVLPAGSGLNQSPWSCTITNTSGTIFHIVGPSYYIQPGATSSDAGAILKVPSTTYIPIPINIAP